MRTFFPDNETARNAFNTMLSSGACYWLAIVRPNPTDTWTAMAFGSIPMYSLSGYDVKTGRLVDVSDIQQEIDIYSETFAKTPTVDIEIYNSDAVISQEDLLGRQVEIRMGYGETMSIATSELFFTGKVKEIDKNDLHKIKFICVGLLNQFNGEIGIIAPDAFNEDTGKIYPIVNGDWSDADAYCPLLRGAFNKQGILYIYGDNLVSPLQPVVYIYDKNNKYGYIFQAYASDNVLTYVGNKVLLSIGDSMLTQSISLIDFDNIIVETTQTIYERIDLSESSYQLYIERAQALLSTSSVGLTMEVISKNTSNGKYYLTCSKTSSEFITVPTGTIYYVIEKEGSVSQKARQDIIIPFTGIKNTTIAYPTRTTGIRQLLGDYSTALRQYSFFYQEASISFNPICNIPEIDGSEIVEAWFYANGTINSPTVAGTVKIKTLYNSTPKEDSETISTTTNEYKPFSLSIQIFTDLNGVALNGFLEDILLTFSTISPNNSFTTTTSNFEETYLKITAQVDLSKTVAWGRSCGKKCPNYDYFNNTYLDLMTNPSSVIEDFCRTSVPSMTSTNLNEASFDSYFTDRTDWKLATAIYSGMK